MHTGRLDAICAVVCALGKYIQQNGLAMEKITKKCDKFTGSSLLPWVSVHTYSYRYVRNIKISHMFNICAQYLNS